MRSLVALLAAVLVVPAAASAAAEEVSVTLTPGPGVLLTGAPALRLAPDGSAEVSLRGVEVLDASGSAAGWTLVAQIDYADGQGSDTLVRRSGSPSDELRPIRVSPGTFVTLTAGPAL